MLVLGTPVANKLKITDPPLTRERLVDPETGRPFLERLAETDAVDLRNNIVIERTEGGYARIHAIDPTRRFR